MHSSQFGITFTDSRGPVNLDGPIHCIRSLNRMVRYSVMPLPDARSWNLERKKKNNKVSRTHIQIIVRVFGGLDTDNGGGKTHLKQKKGSWATLFLFYRPCCGKWGCFWL